MKKMFRALVPGILATLVLTTGSVSIFAQDDACSDIEANQALYKKYTDNHEGKITRENIADKEMAVQAAKEYVDRYSPCSDFSAQVNYLKKAGPNLDERVTKAKERFAKEDRRNAFDNAVKSGNTSQIFSAGAEILKYEPEFIDVKIVLASVGLDEAAAKKNDTYNNETIGYANQVIGDINRDVKSLTGNWGAFKYEYKTKENTLGWMNYTLGMIKFYRQKKEDEGLEYFYKATQYDSETKDQAFIYSLIGDKYSREVAKLSEKIVATFKANENKESFESKSLEALLRGYLDRAIDAYAKAYQLNKKKNDAASLKAAANLYESLKTLYKVRYETVDNPMTDEQVVAGLDTYVATVQNKSLPSPNSEVQPVNPPVMEEETDNN